ncbi:P-type ATPase, translocating [Salinarchaeum sp. Harcht-Bsk1]|uniref:HAD-IC family P-type ATPase n=1 Tax=Salinarchaeum sp. Harcht-Bsk1 TaxID=1333523 RepID=UPI00034248E1|nr:cation-translocating P-type ATPase [Salinarchaeum sp. Harcht-Bsk1]AGN00827.1 P-type ATPase, translocating [Salinarchaeum sp. Harcht-Bsk1]
MDEHPIRTPWAKSSAETLAHYDVSAEEGLSEDDVETRRERVGPNALREAERRDWWNVLADQFKSFIVLLLAVAGVAAFALDETIEGVSILVVLLINGLIGFVTELRAIKSMESLQEMTEIEARVRRDGEVEKVPAEDLVPGDVVLLDAGNVVPADLRVIDPSKLQADESALTGESVPVGKTSEVLEEDAPLAERENMLYKGTSVTRGTAEAVVTMSFLTLAFAQLWHVFNMRELASGIVRNEVTRNPYVWGALVLSASLVIGTLYLPGVSLALSTTPIGPESWLVVLGMSLLPLGAGQVVLEFRRRVGTPNLGTRLGRLFSR